MKIHSIGLGVLLSLFLFACTSPTKKATGDPNQPGQVTARGYSKEGCLLNLKLEARERNMRLNPNDVKVETNSLMFFFTVLDYEGYRCSGSVTEREKRVFSQDSLYPVD
ncbi:MAG: hypothetical protein OEV99_06080 [Nitrospira sp.]|nr:hypothetical protein [Nitrospira sp.]MDH4369397.1 hypothetical protein [Nitrospira sp.]MDH5497601.1 hypothetical protein [Nitrospira sp.]MDH5724696.1 hypothetical protein [Nitrospira sp.]